MPKKQIAFILSMICLLLIVQPAAAADAYHLERSDYTFMHEYDSITMPSFLIDNEVYVPLHVFSDYFGIAAQFEPETQSINLDFDSVAGEEQRLQDLTDFVRDTDRRVTYSPHKLFAQENPFEVPMLIIDGYNFVRTDLIAEGYGLRTIVDTDSKIITLTQDELLGSPYLPKFEAYLKNNQIAIQTDSMSVLPETEFDSYKVYLIGEQHGIAKNFDIQLYFIRYLNTHQGVRHILVEDGFCNTMLLNRYIETGDVSIIDEMVSGAKGSSAYSKEYYDFYVSLRAYNETLPKDKRLFFVGLDVQHNAEVGASYLASLFSNDDSMPQSVRTAYDALISPSEEKLREVSELFQIHKGDFETYFGNRIFDFTYGLRSVIQGLDFYEEADFELREQFIHDNFRDLYATYNMDKCFGMFGGAHTLLNGSLGDIPNLASYMNNDHDPTKNLVCSIMTNYIDCYYMDNRTGESTPVLYSHNNSVSRLLNQATQSDLILFPLTREGSAFVESGFTDAFQYYLCVKNSPAATPYGILK